MNEELKKPYDPNSSEDPVYKLWEESGFFNPDICEEKGVVDDSLPPFSIVLPPPNVTGTLHIGHAFEDSIQDTAVRFNRMKGRKTLWIPGTDHAAIATQSKVEKILEKDGIKKSDLGREKFLERVNQFAADSRNTIVSQVRKVGASLDWSREAFTLDEKRAFAVRTAFKKFYDLGLIYRGYKIVNWDPKGQTVISDDEVKHEEREAVLYTFKYSKDFPIAISTTRPETKVGDTAVAVHPSDERYNKFIGKSYDLNFAGIPLNIKIVADQSVDPEFGTGALGVTPAHSQIDAEIAERHDLPMKQVINEFAKMTVNGDLALENKKTTEARTLIAEWLKKEGLLTKEEKVKMNISVAERSGGVIEPLPKMQWFIAVNKEFTLDHSEIKGIESGSKTTLKKIMQTVVENGQIEIIPDNFGKIYFNWINNLRDWCISRQLWFGHRIPVWYNETGEVRVSIEEIDESGWSQDSDTLDTWFSSGLWTFSTLGWPEITEDLKTYHPTTLMAPGYEIIFFWVARMILFSGTLLGTTPFKTVYLHGIVRDKNGNKFSKSAGNGIDPIDVIKEYGADALRMSLVVGVGPGSDSKFDFNKVKAYKHFANKIWNASRFVLENTQDFADQKVELDEYHAGLLNRLDEFVKDITEDMENYRFYMASEKAYHYFWHEFADVIIEESKARIKAGGLEKQMSQYVLLKILETSLIVLHPFMPFITERIWRMLPNRKNLLIVEKWPYKQ